MAQLILAQLSTSMEEASVEQWLVEDGSTVAAGQPIVSVMTDKVELELEAPSAGTLRIRVAEGETVPVGTVLADVE